MLLSFATRCNHLLLSGMAESRDELRSLVDEFHATLTTRWDAIRIELRFFASHRAFSGSDVSPFVKMLDDLVASLSTLDSISPTIAGDASSLVEVHWPALISLFDRDSFHSLLCPLVDRFARHNSTFSQSIAVKKLDAENFRGFYAALLVAQQTLAQDRHEIGAVLPGLASAVGSIGYFARSPDLLKIDPQLPADFVQLSDLVQLMERWAFTRTLAEQAHAEIARGMLLEFAYLQQYGAGDARRVEAANDDLLAALKREK
jgi:hypothetical protein